MLTKEELNHEIDIIIQSFSDTINLLTTSINVNKGELEDIEALLEHNQEQKDFEEKSHYAYNLMLKEECVKTITTEEKAVNDFTKAKDLIIKIKEGENISQSEQEFLNGILINVPVRANPNRAEAIEYLKSSPRRDHNPEAASSRMHSF
ncbi:MAG: hypothetical protein A3F18_00385 [Legionellales bacterium RIFCSPHIGHO2_12_FULL_37_14]|nr:MAG: hypothetical protein A3F18_00385 [Legionellales bacterium RIFCSPHIGHO2_12_FULL_37_14]